MANDDQLMYMVRAGQDAYIIEDFLEKKIVAIGWHKMGDVTKLKTLDDVKDKLREAYPQFKPGKVNICAAQIFKFRHELEKGTQVLTYDPNERVYWIGVITSDYKYDANGIDGFPHVRSVKWKKSVSRDLMKTESKNSLGSAMHYSAYPNTSSMNWMVSMRS